MKTIGIAICAYKGHISQLKDVLDSIEKQTKKPDNVVISCSSCTDSDIPYTPDMYSFPFRIITHSEKKNSAQNRNCAGALVNTDIIAFFDADDIMHPQRIEIIYKCFVMNDIKIFLHNTTIDTSKAINFGNYTDYLFIINKLGRCSYGTTILNIYMPGALIANGHVTVAADVLKNIQFNDTVEYYTREDTKFSTDVIVAYPNQTAYCNLILSYYRPSGTGGYLC